jgi:hypothetical protein
MRRPWPELGRSTIGKNGLYIFRDHERYFTELETINAIERTEEERMVEKIILWNEIQNTGNNIFCNTLC